MKVFLLRRRWLLLALALLLAGAMILAACLPETAGLDVCRVIFTGEAEGQGVDLPALESAFRDRVYALELRDRTRPAQSLWEKAGENSLRGLFLQEMKIKYDAAKDDAAREQVTMAVRFGLAALEGRDIG